MKKVIKVLVSVALTFQANLGHAEGPDLAVLGCMLEPSKKVLVSSPVPGVLDKVLVKRGDTISIGDKLFELKAGVERESLALAKAKAAFASRNAKRNESLYDEDILTVHERDEIETELQIARLELRLKQQELALREVSSPLGGVVVSRINNEGEYVDIDPVLILATLDPLHVDLLLPASYFGEIGLAQRLLINPDSDKIEAREAEVTIVDPLIDSASGTFRVQLVMSNPDNSIPAGIRCTAQLLGESLL